MKRKETLAEKTAVIYSGKKENATTKKLESLLLENGFIKVFSGSTDGGWNKDVDCFRLEFTKGNEKVFVNVTKPKKGVTPMTYAEFETKSHNASIPGRE